MGVLRFPNAVSDVDKFISTFKMVYDELKTKENFSHDDARDALIKNGLVSSSGAIGQEAVKRSVRDDRSRDPLYNQLKMYSELYRMLGWYKPGTKNTNFNFTELAHYIGISENSIQKRIFEECLLSIVFPNPLVENIGGNIIRPFPIILELARQLGGVIVRDEIIVAVLSIQNDKKANTIKNQVNYIRGLRGSGKKLKKELALLAKETKTQINTLQNYTRFPLGGMLCTGWFERDSIKDIYERPLIGYRITKYGIEKANEYISLRDVRNNEIKEFSIEERGIFTLLSHYYFIERSGFDITSSKGMIELLEPKAVNIFKKLNVKSQSDIFYSPMQQGLTEEIDEANILEDKYSK